MSEIEHLMEEWRITERRGGAIYKTEKTGNKVWRTLKEPRTVGDLTYASLSTSELMGMNASEYMRVRR